MIVNDNQKSFNNVKILKLRKKMTLLQWCERDGSIENDMKKPINSKSVAGVRMKEHSRT